MAKATTTPTEIQTNKRWNKGSSYDVRKRIQNMLRWWGDTVTCDCVWCGRTLRNNPGDGSGTSPADHVSVDHIICHADGGRYVMTNLVPSCQNCNKKRGRKDFFAWAAEKGVNAEAIKAHAEKYTRKR